MKSKDFIRIVFFIFVFFLLNGVFSDLFVYWTRAETKDGVTIQGFEYVEDQVDVVVLGDSHPKESIMAGKIEGGYNLASSAESYITTYYKMKYYLEKGDFIPAVAVIPIDLHSFSTLRINSFMSKDPAFWNQYVDYLEFGIETDTLNDMYPIILNSKLGLLGGLDLLVSGMDSDPFVLIDGYALSERRLSNYSTDIILERAVLRVDSQFGQTEYMDEVLIDYFLRLLNLLDSYGVDIVLVFYPVTDIYFDQVSRYVSVDQHFSIVKDLVAEAPHDLVLDYHNLYWGELEYFSDPDHLNGWGAEIFTEQLLKDLEKAGLLSLSPIE